MHDEGRVYAVGLWVLRVYTEESDTVFDKIVAEVVPQGCQERQGFH